MADLIQTPQFGFNNRKVANNVAGPNNAQKPNQPYILDLVTLERLYFQNIPNDHKYNPDASWAVIASPGRNTPIYLYDGSEDVLSFTLSWYCEESDRQDVLTKVKWLESLTKNDGYDNKPHPVQCVWGQMYRDAKWIVFSAGPINWGLHDRQFGMLPKLATQELVLKRIAEVNRTRADVLNIYT